jgi:hypothetical protein
MSVLRDVVIPLLSAYVVLAGVVIYAARHPDTEPVRVPRAGWRSRLRMISVTVAGGYAVFLAIVLVFHVWIAGQRAAIASALGGGSFLALMCAGAFLLGSILEAAGR